MKVCGNFEGEISVHENAEFRGGRAWDRPGTGDFRARRDPPRGRRSDIFGGGSEKKPQRGVFFLRRKIHLLKGPPTGAKPDFGPPDPRKIT